MRSVRPCRVCVWGRSRHVTRRRASRRRDQEGITSGIRGRGVVRGSANDLRDINLVEVDRNSARCNAGDGIIAAERAGEGGLCDIEDRRPGQR